MNACITISIKFLMDRNYQIFGIFVRRNLIKQQNEHVCQRLGCQRLYMGFKVGDVKKGTEIGGNLISS